eukprot:1068505-Rhodomonas_salina.2
MSGTAIGRGYGGTGLLCKVHYAIPLRICSIRPSTNTARGTIILRARYATPSTNIVHGAIMPGVLCAVRYLHSGLRYQPTCVLCDIRANDIERALSCYEAAAHAGTASYAMSGTDLACGRGAVPSRTLHATRAPYRTPRSALPTCLRASYEKPGTNLGRCYYQVRAGIGWLQRAAKSRALPYGVTRVLRDVRELWAMLLPGGDARAEFALASVLLQPGGILAYERAVLTHSVLTHSVQY